MAYRRTTPTTCDSKGRTTTRRRTETSGNKGNLNDAEEKISQQEGFKEENQEMQ
ncbi:hypothetical protein A2U01_0019036 [Trifolium medium]|uniref:Uncharacterized protein n=1 Tax=Trifolium medium TaxID=97028 RepID=A0A392NDT9_9FABA|nr:hypothetical protein [Trifolium medium]